MKTYRPIVAILLVTATMIAGCGGESGGSSSGGGGKFASITYRIKDSCSDGRGLQFKLFEPATNRVWPGDNRSWRVQQGSSETVTIENCTRNELVCHGGSTLPNNGKEFGVGMRGDKKGVDCLRCGSSGGNVSIFCSGLF